MLLFKGLGLRAQLYLEIVVEISHFEKTWRRSNTYRPRTLHAEPPDVCLPLSSLMRFARHCNARYRIDRYKGYVSGAQLRTAQDWVAGNR